MTGRRHSQARVELGGPHGWTWWRQARAAGALWPRTAAARWRQAASSRTARRSRRRAGRSLRRSTTREPGRGQSPAISESTLVGKGALPAPTRLPRPATAAGARAVRGGLEDVALASASVSASVEVTDLEIDVGADETADETADHSAAGPSPLPIARVADASSPAAQGGAGLEGPEGDGRGAEASPTVDSPVSPAAEHRPLPVLRSSGNVQAALHI